MPEFYHLCLKRPPQVEKNHTLPAQHEKQEVRVSSHERNRYNNIRIVFSERPRRKLRYILYLRKLLLKILYSRKWFNVFSLLRSSLWLKLIHTEGLVRHHEWCSLITCHLRDKALWSMTQHILPFSTWVTVTFLFLTFCRNCGDIILDWHWCCQAAYSQGWHPVALWLWLTPRAFFYQGKNTIKENADNYCSGINMMV